MFKVKSTRRLTHLDGAVVSDKVAGSRGAGRRKTTSPRLPPISSDESISIERRVYAALRLALMTGSVQPDQRLSSRSLSAAFGISPTPVREALKRLEADGALISKNKSAFFVNDPDQTDFAEILDVRINLEGLAIRAAARRIQKHQLLALRKLNTAYEKLKAADTIGHCYSLAPNFRFHFEAYKLAGSQTLLDMIETLWLRIGPTLHRSVAIQAGTLAAGNFHNAMLEALERRDEEAAAQALRADLVTAAREIMPQLRVRVRGVQAATFPKPR
ncbi:MAG: GntR family transcriptional regulator [Burkholderiaceae bacterium]|nr:GntR family transcriptional regulator [Burkholderiaceae bacterium]